MTLLKLLDLMPVWTLIVSAHLAVACGGADDSSPGGGSAGSGGSGGGAGHGGSGGDGGGVGIGSGTVTDTWADFCVGTFTEDTTIVDIFDDPVFTALAGQKYMLLDYSTSGAEFAYFTDVGPESFEVEPDDTGAFPFTSNCDPSLVLDYYAVFTDVSVYSDETLTTKICDLEAGTALPATEGSRGFVTAGGPAADGSLPYQIFLNAFSEQCGGAEIGFIGVPRTEVFGTTTWLIPIISIIGPV